VAGSCEHADKPLAFFVVHKWYVVPASFVIEEGNYTENGLKVVYFAS
jgi:hypothetical protein